MTYCEHYLIAWPFKVAKSELSGSNCWWHVWETDPHSGYQLEFHSNGFSCVLFFMSPSCGLGLLAKNCSYLGCLLYWRSPKNSVQLSATSIHLRLVNPADARDVKNNWNGHQAFLISRRGTSYHLASQNRCIETSGSWKKNQHCAICGRSTCFCGGSGSMVIGFDAWR